MRRSSVRVAVIKTAAQSESAELVAPTPCFEELQPSDLARSKVVILDLHLPGMEGPEPVRFVRAAGADVLVLSASDDPAEVIEAIGAGAAGYLTNSAETDEIVQAIRTVLAGGLELVAEGETDADIAAQLYTSVHTVHSHLDRIREKTGQRRRPDLTGFAIEHDIRRQEKD